MTIPTRVVVAHPGRADPVLEDAFLPDPGPHQVLVSITASGICQSQLHQLRSAAAGAVDHVRALGHEALGVVDSVGSAVRGVRPGQHVLISWIPDADAAVAREIEPARLELVDGTVAQSPDVYTWATRCLVDEAFLFGLPGPVAPEYSIIGCAVPTGAGAVLHTGGLTPGQSLAVIGVGGVGANAVAAAHAAGAAHVVAIDLDEGKLTLARSLGATTVVDTSRARPVEVLAEQLPGGVDVVIDCVATQETLDAALHIARPGVPGVRVGGTIVVVGVATAPLTVDVRRVQTRELRVVGSFGGSSVVRRDFPRYLSWAAEKTIDLDILVGETYGLADVRQAVDDLAAGRVSGRGIIIL